MSDDEKDIDLSDLYAMGALFGDFVGSSANLEQFADAILLKRLKRFEPIRAACTFANLLLQPALQANTYRAEVLAQLALACGKGGARIDASALRHAYNKMDQSIAGRLEDPPEDVFVGQVRCGAGNFRVLEGMWEGNTFYLQRILELLEMLPDGVMFNGMRASVLAVVRISERLCERAGLSRWLLGDENGRDLIDAKQSARFLVGRNRLTFSPDELAELRVDLRALEPFLFNFAHRSELLNSTPNESPLEQRPLVFDGNNLHVVLPTAVGAAVRTFVISTLQETGKASAVSRAIANVYTMLWYETQLLGLGMHQRIAFKSEGDIWIGELTKEIDRGRHLHLLFMADPLNDMDRTGVGGVWNPMDLGDVVDRRVASAWQAAQGDDYRGGLTILVGCGVGRGMAFGFGERETPGWRVESLPAYDLHTLSSLPRFDALTLWRLLDQRDDAARLGLGLMNVNGLINLVAWSRRLDGHVVPHADLPDGAPIALMAIDQTALRSVRHEVALATDAQVAPDVHGNLLRIRRDFDDTFQEDAHTPLYGSEDSGGSGKPMSAFLAPNRVWWADLDIPQNIPGHVGYQRWKTVQVWLARVAPILDELPGLPAGPIQWTAKFEGPVTDGPLVQDRLDFVGTRQEIAVSAEGNIVTTRASKRFERAWLNEENVAERALVSALIDGVAELAGGASEAQKSEWVAAVVSHPLAKQQHGFVARGFRDWIREAVQGRPITITREDDAGTRLGLAWKVRDRTCDPWIEGKAECNVFLAKLVHEQEEEICAALRGFERAATIEALLLNHERAAFDRDLWNRTAASNLALRQDRMAAMQTLVEHQARLSAASLGSRLLIEVAASESPLCLGKVPGALDISRLLAQMLLVFKMGGWSDAIRWDAMLPKLRVTPLGDVHGTFDWHERFVMPFGEQIGTDRVQRAEDSYAENLEELPIKQEVELDSDFAGAWAEQFGATFQETRIFIEALENLGRQKGTAILQLAPDELKRFQIDENVVGEAAAQRLVSGLLLPMRSNWRNLPEGYEPKDAYPWRFKRRLSLLRKPLIQLTNDVVLVAPGMLREAFVFMLGNYLQGEFPRDQLSPLMAKWQDKVVGKRGRELAEDVAAKLKESGWTTWIEKGLPEILNQKLDRDYGDVDVLAKKGERVLVIECKDLKYAKTDGEITEQVRDYLGLERNGKKDELRKHLDRVEKLRQHIDRVSAFTRIAELKAIESHLVFRNPTPVIFALQNSQHDVRAWQLADVTTI